MLSKNFKGGGAFISVWGSVFVCFCVCAGQGWTLFWNEPQSKVNFLFVLDLTQDTYVSLLLKIRCQKPPNMLSRSHRIQFGRRALHCVTGAKQKCSDILSLCSWRVTLQNPFLSRKACELGVLCSFFYLPLLFSAALEFTSISVLHNISNSFLTYLQTTSSHLWV